MVLPSFYDFVPSAQVSVLLRNRRTVGARRPVSLAGLTPAAALGLIEDASVNMVPGRGAAR
jgi:hypothetical protein